MTRSNKRAIGVAKALIAGFGLIALSATASHAANVFTIDPGDASPTPLAGTTFTAASIILSDYATISLAGAGTCGAGCSTFIEQGFLSVSQFQNGSQSNVASFLNAPNGYGMYFTVTAQGNQLLTPDGSGNLDAQLTGATFALYGYNTGAGNTTANFSVAPSGTTQTATLANVTELATGTLENGTGQTNGSSGVTGANLKVTFVPEASEISVFASPTPFYLELSAAFTTLGFGQDVTTFGTFGLADSGIEINNGAGTAQFDTPEPASMGLFALALGGLAAVRRRKTAV